MVTKIYPGILLLLLVSQRRWRELGTTLAWVLGFGLLGLAVLGAAPYEAFFTYHLPRILSGEAFLQGDIITAITVGIGDLPGKLRLLGVTSSGEVLGFLRNRFSRFRYRYLFHLGE